MSKHFYPDRSGLFQDDKIPIHRPLSDVMSKKMIWIMLGPSQSPHFNPVEHLEEILDQHAFHENTKWGNIFGRILPNTFLWHILLVFPLICHPSVYDPCQCISGLGTFPQVNITWQLNQFCNKSINYLLYLDASSAWLHKYCRLKAQ